jgi:hypothetical protein
MTEEPEILLTKFQKSEQVILKRSEIKNAPYNPRKISDEALTQLRKNFRRVGLLGGIVVNKRTMNIVSGHQRLKALDDLEKKGDYLIRVEMIDVDEMTEKEQNIFMNSHSVQGEFDVDALRIMVEDIDYSNAGLTEMDLSIIGLDINIGEGIEDVSQELNQLSADQKKEKIKASKKAIRNDIDDKFEEGDPLLVLSFDSFKNKSAFMRRFELDEYQKFFKGEIFSEMIERV